MAGNFARGLHTVVARNARRVGGAVIHFCAGRKSARRVAHIARLYGGNMIQTFATRKLAVMTTRTLPRQAIKYGIYVTRFACQMRVHTNQGETGGKMVEVFVESVRIRAMRRTNPQQRKQHK